jgi:DNA-binding transcriptional ArsR family regulator
VKEILRSVAARRTWDERDRHSLQAAIVHVQRKGLHYSEQYVPTMLSWWSRPDEFGERYLQALQSYQEAFFASEELRIGPAQQAALARAQDLARRLAPPDLVEELTQGLRFSEPPAVAELVLAPSFWGSPLLFVGDAGADRDVWLFGARPADASLVPGEAVPDTLLRSLKALSDSTRLRIVRLLSREALTPAQLSRRLRLRAQTVAHHLRVLLSRRLRLRAQTVAHHLRVLRLAGLVQLTIGEDQKKEPYAARSEAVAAAFASLQGFLEAEEED